MSNCIYPYDNLACLRLWEAGITRGDQVRIEVGFLMVKGEWVGVVVVWPDWVEFMAWLLSEFIVLES